MAKTRKTIGVIISQLENEFHSRSLAYLEQELFRMDMNVLVFTTLCASDINLDFAEGECSIYYAMNFDELDGIIVFPQSLNLQQHQRVLERLRDEYRGPVVSVEAELWDYPYIPFTETEGMELLVEHLATVHGAKRIEYVSAPNNDNPYYRLLRQNFLDAMKNHGLETDEQSVHYGDGWLRSGDAVVQELLHQPGGLPEALICCNAESAAALIAALEERAVYVPKDIRVVGYGLPSRSGQEERMLATVDRNPKATVCAAARKMQSLLAGRDEFAVLEEKCCYLVPGCSCGCNQGSLGVFSRRLVKEMESKSTSFEADYNFMTEEITECADYKACMWKTDQYTHYLGKYESFYLCLNENALRSREPVRDFTDQMILGISHEKTRNVDLNSRFEQKLMLPALYEPCDHPRAFVMAPLHFVSHVMGYVAVSYGNQCRGPEHCMHKWLRSVANALEIQRGRNLLNEVLQERHVKDSTTGLYNYRGYLKYLREKFTSLEAIRKVLCIWSFDIDRFSEINEKYGREEGNQVLYAFARLIEGVTGEQEICARIGSDEFLIGRFSNEIDEYDNLVNVIQDKVNELNEKLPFRIQIHNARVAEWVSDVDQIADISNNCTYKRRHLKQSLRAHAKESEHINEEEQSQVLQIIEDNKFTYQFQPIVQSRNGKIYAYEALMRSGKDCRIAPLAILEHAKRNGRLYDVEYHTFSNLLEVVAQHPDIFEKRKLFINSIPVATLKDSDFEKLCAQYGDLLRKIVIEFTEQTEAAEEQLVAIRNRRNQIGFETAVDDYGSGYSNVSNLLTYMPNYVKIDRSLITDIAQDTNKQHFVTNVIQFAHENGFMALAEGVETATELYTVINLGVDLVQGYYTCRPQDEMVDRIHKDRVAEIIDINNRLRTGRVKKTYRAESGETVDIIDLYDKEYTEVQIGGSDVIIVGDPERYIDMTIRVPDGLEGVLTLENVGLEGYSNRPCIELGNNCKTNLMIDGKVRLQNKGVRVPESSSVTLEGDGDLMIRVQSNGCYAVGGASTQNFGGITIRMRGHLDIQASGRESVGVGGGYASSAIRIADTHMSIQMDCVTAIACGAFYSRVSIDIRNTQLDLVMNVNTGTGVGSVSGEADITLNGLQITYRGGGDSLSVIGSLDGTNCVLSMQDSDLKAYLCAKECYGLVCRSGSMDMQLLNTKLEITLEGMRALGIGSQSHMGKGQFESCIFNLQINSSNGVTFGYEPEKMSFLFCEGMDEEE